MKLIQMIQKAGSSSHFKRETGNFLIQDFNGKM